MQGLEVIALCANHLLLTSPGAEQIMQSLGPSCAYTLFFCFTYPLSSHLLVGSETVVNKKVVLECFGQ